MVADTAPIRLAELLGALSYALDLAEGQAAGHVLRCCLVGMALGERIGLDAETRSELYYGLLLKDAGCSDNASRIASLLHTDDRAAKQAFKLSDWTRRSDRFRYAARMVAPDDPPRERFRRLSELARRADTNRTFIRLRCERGAQIADGLGFPPATAAAIYALDEHWDGGGYPDGRQGEEIPRLARIMCLAQTVEVFASARGRRAAMSVARRRRGRWFDPAFVDALEPAMLSDVPDRHEDLLAAVAAYEPADRAVIADEERLTRVAQAFAEVIDAKSPSTGGHSHRVAALASATAEGLGQPPDRALVRAALLHDIGKLGVSSRILDKTGPLTEPEWREVREHPVHTRELLRRVGPLRPVAAIAAAHHERLDGSGYPNGLRAPDLPLAARVIAVADVYEALASWRPYRDALTPRAAVATLREEAAAGRLDGDCVEALAAFVLQPGHEHGMRTPMPEPAAGADRRGQLGPDL